MGYKIKRKNKALLKTLSLFFVYLYFSCPYTYSQQPVDWGDGANRSGETFKDNTRKVSGHQISENNTVKLERLKENLKAGEFVKVIATPGGNKMGVKEEITDKVFKTECLDIYNNFNKIRNNFIVIYEKHNDPYYTQKPSLEDIVRIEQNIKTSIANCTVKIYNNYLDVNKEFGRKIVQTYRLRDISSIDVIYPVKEDLSQISNLNGNGQTENFKEIKQKITEYILFEKICIDGNQLESIGSIKCTLSEDDFGREDSCSFNINNADFYVKLKNVFHRFNQGFEGKSCSEWRNNLLSFTKQSVFKNFIALPKQCKEQSGCVATMNKRFNPLFPTENLNNFFYQCSLERGKAYEQCYGDENRQKTENQKILEMIDGQSTELCEKNRLAQAGSAKQNCENAINQCMSGCDDALNSFKEDFLQCFYLPDFSLRAYQILHKNTACKGVIEDFNKQFVSQAKKQPFNIKDPNFHSLQKPNDNKNFTAFHIIEKCSDPLESHEIDRKHREMQVICQNHKKEEDSEKDSKEQQSPHLIDPATTGHSSSSSSSFNSPKGKKSVESQNSAPFSYGKSNPFNYDGSGELAGDSYSSNSNLQIAVPSSSSDDNPLSTDTNSVSADFEKSSDDKLSSNSNSNSSPRYNPSQRGLASSMRYNSSSPGEELGSSLTDSTKEESQTIGSKVSQKVRTFLSSSAEYGIVKSPSKSTTSGFFNWMNNRVKKSKKQALKAYDGMLGISRAEVQKRLQLNDKHIDLFELQSEMFLQACQTHNCDGSGASPEVQM